MLLSGVTDRLKLVDHSKYDAEAIKNLTAAVHKFIEMERTNGILDEACSK